MSLQNFLRELQKVLIGFFLSLQEVKICLEAEDTCRKFTYL
jgi:hypothetical protein